SENDASEVRAEMQLWIDFAHGTGVHSMLVHHENKSGGEFGRQVRGSGDLVAAADVALFLSRLATKKNDEEALTASRRKLTAMGRYDAEPPEDMLLDYDAARGYFLVGGAGEIKTAAAVRAKTDEKYEEFVAWFPERESVTV